MPNTITFVGTLALARQDNSRLGHSQTITTTVCALFTRIQDHDWGQSVAKQGGDDERRAHLRAENDLFISGELVHSPDS